MPEAIAWVDEVAPDEAVRICGAKMGRLAELLRAGVSPPKGFTVTVEAFRRHWDQMLLDFGSWTCIGREIEAIWQADDDAARALRKLARH